jgi:hypothetical protein
MPSSPPRSHRVRERDKPTVQEYFTTDRAPLRGASMRARAAGKKGDGQWDAMITSILSCMTR